MERLEEWVPATSAGTTAVVWREQARQSSKWRPPRICCRPLPVDAVLPVGQRVGRLVAGPGGEDVAQETGGQRRERIDRNIRIVRRAIDGVDHRDQALAFAAGQGGEIGRAHV